jgi:hypothetical protein
MSVFSESADTQIGQRLAEDRGNLLDKIQNGITGARKSSPSSQTHQCNWPAQKHHASCKKGTKGGDVLNLGLQFGSQDKELSPPIVLSWPLEVHSHLVLVILVLVP